ncbi:hypothetical protein MGG_03222 [Pyricularia oryzae 70-15]|uniref:Sfi1 spindle body domain-containing protein n=3 Tax=Pyricularia oryzae TaxID=318829 RepID=G4N9Y6_PYRO7|nr:uncharacterized protein MGG_03222 [Pyricularia oryzae 70-15]EHA50438.1 hypothetical protein MGG_03222 [Pyricularia oryzae 70-15]ELQ34490.1 hypothetical protein OOU_Y34scaffold00765g36 [Pyricularia oryzae Y34]KAI7931515.1 hypothetical protein M9X92_000346 [Pyricularia oryzae]KAI7931590.1 hypothetical protein M0657_001088 [Pyricularia oryzae]
MPPTDLLSSDGDGRPCSSLSSHNLSSYNPPSSPGPVEPYYSNEEISIIYESVLRGQEILAADEKRTLTETAALFEGSEQVFPQHGISTDDPRLSRLLFKIGGRRGVGPGLLRKFRSVLEGMDIEINLDGHPLRSTDAGDDDRPGLSTRSNSFAHLPGAATNSSISSSPRQRPRADGEGDVPVASNLNGHSRIHFEALANPAPNGVAAKTDDPQLPRAVSFVSSTEDFPARPLPEIDPQTPAAQWGAGFSGNNGASGQSSQATSPNRTRSLLRPLPAAFGRVNLPIRPAVPPSVSSAADSPQRPSQPVRSLPAPQAQHDLPMLSRWLQSSISNPRSFRATPRSANLDVPEINWAGGARPHRIQVAESSLDADEIIYEDEDGDIGEVQSRSNDNRDFEVANEHLQPPLRPKPTAEPQAAASDLHDADVSGNGDADGNEEHLFGYGSLLGPQRNDTARSARHLAPSALPKQYTRVSSTEVHRHGQALNLDEIPGVRHSETPLPPYGSPPRDDENFAGSKWPERLNSLPASHPVSQAPMHQEDLQNESELQQSVLADMAAAHRSFHSGRVGGLLKLWRDQRSRVSASNDYMESLAGQMERRFLSKKFVNSWRLAVGMARARRAEAAETARQLVETARREERIMKRAERAYELSLLHKAFTHWWTAAHEEVERTEIARRHLLRKKVFDGWSQKVSADKYKAFNFAASGALLAWRTATKKQEEQEEVALQMRSRGLVKIAFAKLFRRHQECVADAFNSTRLGQWAILTWSLELQSAAKLWTAAEADASHMRQSNALSMWQSRRSDMFMFQSMASSLVLDHDAAAIFEFWRKQAKLESRFREFSNSQRKNMQAITLSTLVHASDLLQMLGTKADTMMLKDFAQHWLRELRLRDVSRRRDHDLLYNQLYEWLMEERYALFYRYSEYNRTAAALSDLRAIHESEKLRQRQLDLKSQRFRRRALLAPFVCLMRSQICHNDEAHKLAYGIDLRNVASSIIQAWTAAAGELESMAHDARLGAYWTAAITCLEGWPSFAREVRRHRLATTYHAASRLRKERMATDAFVTWQEALHDKFVVTWESEAALQDRQLHETIDLMNTWIGETNRMIVMSSVANQADLQVNVNSWRAIASGLENQETDAVIYDIERLRSATLEVWELELVKLRGWTHTATELADKNKKKLARQALGFWLSQTQPRQREADDIVMGGRTPLRSSLRRSYTATAPPNFGGSVLTRPGGRSGSADQDNSDITRSQSQQENPLARRTQEPSGPRQQDSLRGPAYGSSISQGMPSAWFSSRFGSSTTANTPYTPQPKAPHSEQPTPQHSTMGRPSAGFQESRLPPISERSENSTRRFSGGVYPDAAPERPDDSMRSRSEDRIRSFQEKLAQASRFADSVQLGPMSEFDEDEENDGPYRSSAQFGASTASSAFPATPAAPRATGATLPPSILVNTPTRFQSTTRLPFPSTTTPMAPLPSPMERQLREEYVQPLNTLQQEQSSARPTFARGARSLLGTGGAAARQGDSSRLARSWMTAGRQPRVTFEPGLTGADKEEDDNGEQFTNF